jgi:aminoglycoside phosphotransferase
MLVGKHLDRPVRIEVRDGRQVVVKTYRLGGSRDVYDQMLALWRSPFGRGRRPPGLPEPLSVDVETGEVVMALAPGRPLGECGGLGDSVPRAPEVAALLADLHASGVTVRRVRSADRVLASCRRKAADLRAACSETTAASVQASTDPARAAVATAAYDLVGLLGRCRPRQEDLVPSHGDFSARNILADERGVVLVDLDRMQMADPAHDLAHWGAWTWATDAMNGHPPTWEVMDDLVSHYTVHRGDESCVSPANLAFHQGAGLLRIVHGWSALQEQPGVQRLLLEEAARLVGPVTRAAFILHG